MPGKSKGKRTWQTSKAKRGGSGIESAGNKKKNRVNKGKRERPGANPMKQKHPQKRLKENEKERDLKKKGKVKRPPEKEDPAGKTSEKKNGN